jgi:hypothetical protein
MMLIDMTRQYQAERIKSAAEQRRADAELGLLAAEVSRRWRRITRVLAPATLRAGTRGSDGRDRTEPAQQAF